MVPLRRQLLPLSFYIEREPDEEVVVVLVLVVLVLVVHSLRETQRLCLLSSLSSVEPVPDDDPNDEPEESSCYTLGDLFCSSCIG